MLSLSPFWSIALTLVVALVLAQALVLSAHKHGHLTMDLPTGVQKFHSVPTPRVGGIAIYAGVTAAWALIAGEHERRLLSVILLAGMPALLVGLLEDVTKRVSVRTRLLVTMGAGGLAAVLTGIGLTRVDIPLADVLLSVWPLAVLFTAFAVGGVANAINIIDGFHGLASGTVIISTAALAAIAYALGDAPLAIAALVVAAAMGGFWLVNYPWGKLFLGDGGAYFSGFALAWLSVELLARNPSVSPWASVLLCGYPTIEVVYSILRRRKLRQSPGQADRHHLHSLVALRIVHPRLSGARPNVRNAAVSLVMWVCAAVPVIPAILFPTRPDILLPALGGCALAYHLFYRRLADSSEAGNAADSAADVRA
ncbi:MraY family glycosyltransferase [Ramlibacter pallidus]|uniref:Glycosyltransferase family 4 protein n=1 Tax=Ramlibacter pallidus TaxID=2780087 RepID=A0ABR9S833_9BURK|nr:glycosyltransferase [Ramlibacter pallidus]MBE7369427.1 glycosyltransferase family 4 protein [Ramlibacter pallidus]